MHFGILSCSSTRRPETDRAGDVLSAGIVASDGTVTRRALVPDDRAQIAAHLRRWVEERACDVILTTGGTGLGPLDVTPEATGDVLTREVPGLAEYLRMRGMEETPFAALSRGRAGMVDRVLVVNLPGSVAAVRSGLDLLLPLLPHAKAVIGGAGHTGA
jgi:molybdenum cofactor biosynthesis protein B